MVHIQWHLSDVNPATGLYNNRDVEELNVAQFAPGEQVLSRIAGEKSYELVNHLGNVLSVVSDKKVYDRDWQADLQSSQDYYAFGMQMPGRSYNSDAYRFGFNGKENDNEVKGTGNQQDYGMRIYDPRLGRFLSVDPLVRDYAMLTPYQFANNSPVVCIDIDGEEGLWYLYAKAGVYGSTTAKIVNGTEDGVKASVENSWNFVTRDAWQSNTWKQAGFFLEETILSSSPNSNIYNPNTPRVDAAVKSVQDNVINGDAYTRSKFISQATTDILTAYAGSKGISTLKSSAVGFARTNLAARFYANAGFSTERAMEHMRGIDFSKGVQTTTLKEGTVVQQWVGENGIGNYFTSLENGSAKNLGISYEGRTLQSFTLTQDVSVLKSTAATIDGKAGGGTQYFSTDFKSKVKAVKQ